MQNERLCALHILFTKAVLWIRFFFPDTDTTLHNFFDQEFLYSRFYLSRHKTYYFESDVDNFRVYFRMPPLGTIMSCVFYSYILLIFRASFVFNFITLSGSPQLQYMEDPHNAVVKKKRPSLDDCRRTQNLYLVTSRR